MHLVSPSAGLLPVGAIQENSPGLNWWSPATAKSGGKQDDKGKSFPVEGVVHPGALIILPPPLEVARPKVQRNSLPAGNLDDMTVYGEAFEDVFVLSMNRENEAFPQRGKTIGLPAVYSEDNGKEPGTLNSDVTGCASNFKEEQRIIDESNLHEPLSQIILSG
ncbi:hypothetical protein RIF29_39818 [Crotalaria pallida]|uniref:Uncharacterized protein n=1 Tax=Crotalaria pallida TaxID=3830 RepID=A0AAN9E2F0_CROPI